MVESRSGQVRTFSFGEEAGSADYFSKVCWIFHRYTWENRKKIWRYQRILEHMMKVVSPNAVVKQNSCSSREWEDNEWSDSGLSSQVMPMAVVYRQRLNSHGSWTSNERRWLILINIVAVTILFSFCAASFLSMKKCPGKLHTSYMCTRIVYLLQSGPTGENQQLPKTALYFLWLLLHTNHSLQWRGRRRKR